jgi:hypothetical protein
MTSSSACYSTSSGDARQPFIGQVSSGTHATHRAFDNG